MVRDQRARFRIQENATSSEEPSDALHPPTHTENKNINQNICWQAPKAE